MGLRYEDVKDEVKAFINNDKTASKLYARIRNGDYSYATAGRLSQRIGDDIGKVLMRYAPLTDISEWDIDSLIPGVLGLDHDMVMTACKQVQENLNKNAGVNIKFVEPKFDGNRAYGIVEELRNNPEFTNIEKTFYDQLTNFSQNVVDESIKVNADLLYNAGVETVIIRQVNGKCCDWCEEVAGVYDYDEVSNTGNDVWRRHENCRCTIDFVTRRNGGYSERVDNYKK